MKKLKTQMLAVAALLLMYTSAVAADDTAIRIKKSEDQKQTLVRVYNLSEGTAVLRLKDERGRTLHRENITGYTYMKKYNMASLPSGEYTIEVTSDEGISQETFTLNSGVASPVYFKPAVQVQDEIVSIMFKNSVASPVSLKLHDRFGRVLYQEVVGTQKEFSKGLNLSKLNAGEYSLSITGDDYVYSKSIALK